MFTLYYKGSYIHGYCDRDEVRIGCSTVCKSLHAAKCQITRSGRPIM